MERDGLTLVDELASQLSERPSATASHLVDQEGHGHEVTVRALLGRAMAFAARYGPPRDGREVIAVCLYHGADLHPAFLGALWAGHVPTMIAPPSPRMEPQKYTSSFCQMLEHIRPAIVVVDRSTLARLDELALASFPSSQVIDAASVEDAGELVPHRARPDEVALVQHSSGTTGLQKGIALTHRAILEHNRVYAERLGLRGDDLVVSWLPLYHDMGFIACFLLPLLERVPFVELSPFDWVTRPARLLELIHRFRGTLCWLPNFAYQFMADTVKDDQLPADLDLTGVRAWVNSSEPVMDASHRAFLERFARFGVRPAQLTASYAMAENVYAVTQSLPGEYRTLTAARAPFIEEHRIEPAPGSDGLTFVSNGRTVEGTELTVLDDEARPLAPGRVGELAVRGIARFDGYYGRDDLTQAALTPDGFFKTGDLGFVHDGEVYITGRKKDLIIIQGRNFYPTDVERVVGEIAGVVAGRVVAFGLASERSGTEGLVVLAESAEAEPTAQKRLALAIRQRVSQVLDCTPADVRVVPERWLVKSTSGKLARADNRAKYLSTLGAGAAAR